MIWIVPLVTGQKGIGFKSVFKVTDCPAIHSNGFHLRFDKNCGPMGYILPHWAEDERPLDAQLKDINQHRLDNWETVGLSYSRHFDMTIWSVRQHPQYQDPKTEAAKWNSAIIHFIIYTCAFPTVPFQSIFSKYIFMLQDNELKDAKLLHRAEGKCRVGGSFSVSLLPSCTSLTYNIFHDLIWSIVNRNILIHAASKLFG